MTKATVADELVTAVLTASRALVAVSARSLAAVDDVVSLAQFRALVVMRRGSLNLNGLADELGVNSSTAMRSVDKLAAAGLVSRRENPANRREVTLELTGDGARLVDDVTARRRREIARIVGRMPAGRRDELTAALRAFADAAGEPAAGASVGW